MDLLWCQVRTPGEHQAWQNAPAVLEEGSQCRHVLERTARQLRSMQASLQGAGVEGQCLYKHQGHPPAQEITEEYRCGVGDPNTAA